MQILFIYSKFTFAIDSQMHMRLTTTQCSQPAVVVLVAHSAVSTALGAQCQWETADISEPIALKIMFC